MEYTGYGHGVPPHLLNPSRNYGALDIMYTDYEKWQNYVINNYSKGTNRIEQSCGNSLENYFNAIDESAYILRETLVKYLNQSHAGSEFGRPVLDRYGIIRLVPKNNQSVIITDIKCKL